jgi:murein DD-endopeptidase MepM/ murein hydrolase activator NlpD
MKKLKKIFAVIVCLNLLLCSMFVNIANSAEVDVSKQQEEIAQNNAEIEQNKKEIEKLNGKLKDKKEEILSEKEELELLRQKIVLQNDNIVKTQEQIDIYNSQIDEKEKEIKVLEGEIAEQEEEIFDEIEAFKKRLIAMYISNNTDITQILVGTSDFVDILARVQVLESISKQDQKMIEELNAKLDGLKENRIALEDAKVDLQISLDNTKKKKAEFDEALDNLQADLADAEAILDKLTAEGNNIQWEIDVTRERNEDLEEGNKIIEQDIKRKQEAAAKSEAMKNLDPSQKYSGGALGWPVPSSYMVTSGFGPRWGRQHTGLDIAAPKGTPIVASETGIVLTCNVGGWGGGYGTYVVVSHNESLATLYGHMSAVNCSEGDLVMKGDVIGYVGSTGDSTGNHLHFEVRINGSRVDPTGYLG